MYLESGNGELEICVRVPNLHISDLVSGWRTSRAETGDHVVGDVGAGRRCARGGGTNQYSDARCMEILEHVGEELAKPASQRIRASWHQHRCASGVAAHEASARRAACPGRSRPCAGCRSFLDRRGRGTPGPPRRCDREIADALKVVLISPQEDGAQVAASLVRTELHEPAAFRVRWLIGRAVDDVSRARCRVPPALTADASGLRIPLSAARLETISLLSANRGHPKSPVTNPVRF